MVGCELDDASPAACAESSLCGCGIGRCGAGGVAGGASVLELLSLPNQTCGLTAAGTCSGNSSAGAGAAGSSLGSSRSAAKNAASGMFVLCGNIYSTSLNAGSPAASSGTLFHSKAASTASRTLRCKLLYPFASSARFHAMKRLRRTCAPVIHKQRAARLCF